MYKIFVELLELHNVTAYRVAKETKIGQSTFTDWKNGKSSPKPDKLKKIADYFGVTVDYLMGRDDDNKENETLSRDKIELLKLYDKLDPTGQKIALSHARWLVESKQYEKREQKQLNA